MYSFVKVLSLRPSAGPICPLRSILKSKDQTAQSDYSLFKTHGGPAYRRAAEAACGIAFFFIEPWLYPSKPFLLLSQVEMRGFEPLASAVQRRRSPN
jgi:hypothetical protein